MSGLFVYLTVCSIRNSARVKLRRLRQPRYLVIAAGAALYVGSMLLGRPSSGAMGFIEVEGPRARLIASAVATLLLASAWILPAAAALRFTSAEVQFLFSAPITRRELIGYKIWRLLLGAAGSGVFVAVFAGPPRLLPGLLFAAKSTIVVAVLALYSASVAMYRSGPHRWRALGAACLLTPIAGAGLVFVAFASPGEMVPALAVGLALIGANALLVLRSDAAFEEAAAVAADKLNKVMATGQIFQPRMSRSRSTPFRLAPLGRAEPAILWKNWLLLGRTSRRALIVVAIGLGSMLTFTLLASEGDYTSGIVSDLSLVVVAMATLLGPAMIRIDLRQDLGHLALIKTWPVRGAAIIRGEILAPAIALSLIAAAAVAARSFFAPDLPFVDEADARARIAFAIALQLAVTAVIVAQLVVHNGLAVTFPAWVEIKLQQDASGAMEMNVRMMLVMYGALLLLALVLIVPAAGAAAAYFLAGGLLVPAAAFATLLMGECLAATEILGRILDRTDLQDVAVGA